MGCVTSLPAETVNSDIDKAIEKYKAVEQIKYKLLILGAGQSGKSTLMKQFRRLHGRQFHESELFTSKPHLTQNTIEAMRTLAIYSPILADQGKDTYLSTSPIIINNIYLISGYLRDECYALNIPQCIEQRLNAFIGEITFESLEPIRLRVARMSDKQKFTKEHYEDFARLWSDYHIKKVLEYSNQFYLIDTAEYLFSNMHKYWRDEYIPTFQDLIHSYQRTTGVNKIQFVLSDKHGAYEEIYEIFDVGGQKNERRKWIHFFDNTAAVIFLVALSGYNQKLWEDRTKNRMREAIGLFRGIVNLDIFKDTHFIVFLNKLDLFEQKVGKYPVKEHFKEFEGNETKHEVINFFKQKLKDQRRDGHKIEIHFHLTCATDTLCIKKMFESCRAIIIKKELQNQGFL